MTDKSPIPANVQALMRAGVPLHKAISMAQLGSQAKGGKR